MAKKKGMNSHQKAAHKVREKQVGREEIAELLEMSQSAAAEERLLAAQYLCPCHVRCRIEAVWEALFRMLEDADWRVRQAAWHTLEDGGKPSDPDAMDFLERVLAAEAHPKVRPFAERVMRTIAAERRGQENALLWAAGRPAVKQRGKCDFCGAAEVFVETNREVMIPTATHPRAALICDHCNTG